MSSRARGFSGVPLASLRRVPAVFSDFDGTLTTGGRLQASTLAALEALRAAGIPLVLVTGRPAGYGELLCRILPVAGVIAENGGLWFERRGARIERRYAEDEPSRSRNRRRLTQALRQVLAAFPNARLSSDSAYTEVDLAIDHAEDAQLPAAEVGRMEKLCRAKGLRAVRSNVHINCWAGDFDKLSTSRRFAREVLGLSGPDTRRSVYLGDSVNDAPMFGGFPLSVGVGNVLDVWKQLPEKPAFVVSEREGRGAEVVIARLLEVRAPSVRARAERG